MPAEREDDPMTARMPLLLKRQAAADYLGVSVETLTRLVRDHRIARVCLGGDWMYPREELEDFCRRERRFGITLPYRADDQEVPTGSATSTSTAAGYATSSRTPQTSPSVKQRSWNVKPRPWREKPPRNGA
jgi:excisionase family DNA binding protein